MGNRQHKDDDVENQVGVREREVEREHLDALIVDVLGLELIPQSRHWHALERERERVGYAPGDREPDNDVVDKDERADSEDAAEEEEDRQFDQRQADGPYHLVRISCLLVHGQLRCVYLLAIGAVDLVSTQSSCGCG